MKKALAVVLVIVLCLSCTGCGTAEKTPLPCGHEQYLSLIALLENGEYEGAKTWINDTYGLVETEESDAYANASVPEETAITEPKRTGTVEIELTPANFLDFFEYAVDYEFKENAFGEVESVNAWQFVRLKEEYVPNLIRGDGVVVEIAYHYASAYGIIDYENKTFIPNGEVNPTGEEEITKVIEPIDYLGYPLCYSMGLAAPRGNEGFRFAYIDEVLRTQGTLVLSGSPEDYPQTEASPEASASIQNNEPETVEVTLENWEDYFEFAEVPIFSENAFGELDQLVLEYRSQLKDEYLARISKDGTSVVAEFNFTYGPRYCSVDYGTQTYTLGEYRNSGKGSEMGELSFRSGGGFYFTGFGVFPAFEGDTIRTYSDFEVLRIQGTLCLNGE